MHLQVTAWPCRLLLASVLVVFCRTVAAQSKPKYNLTAAVQSTLVAGNQPPGVACNLPGICSPVNQTIPARSLWYWCGFYTTHRTIYTVKSTNPNATFTTMYLMRQRDVMNCALPNVTWVGDFCTPIPESTCSNKTSCNMRVFGLVFPSDMCFVIINNKGSNITATIQLNNFYDRPRYYGTCFVLFFTVVGGLAILANVTWQIYSIIIAPVGRHSEPIKVKRDEDEVDSERAQAPAANGVAGAPCGRPWYIRLMGKLKAHVASDHQM